MSRIGKKPIEIPDGVTVKSDSGGVLVQGPRGILERKLPRGIEVVINGKEVRLNPALKDKGFNSLWGLSRALVANMIKGVTAGFEKKLEMEGIGYRVNFDGGFLVMQLGFSHPVRFAPPEGVKLSLEKNVITVSGADKEAVGEAAARIRSLRPPEPYKGKGIRYQGEILRRKAGKKAVASA